MNGKDVLKILKREGWELVRVSGIHHILSKEGKKTTVPVHATKDLDPKTLKSIERHTGVKLK